MSKPNRRHGRAGARSAARQPELGPVPLVVLPSEITRQGTALMNQQFWLWGRDIRRPDGNLLVARGCAKYPPPAGLRVPSRYELDLADGCRLRLWGFGLAVGPPGAASLFISRLRLAPRLVGPALDIWEPAALPALTKPVTPDQWGLLRPLVTGAFRWIAEYERWIAATCPPAYRRDCLDAWRRPVSTPAGVVSSWTRLAGLMDASLERALNPNRTTGLAAAAVSRADLAPDWTPAASPPLGPGPDRVAPLLPTTV